jgi:4-hydroxythreonine-4-phosphate dehydrogenase
MKNDFVRLVITSGEPAGIGPQISFQAAHQFIKDKEDVNIHLLGDQQLFTPYILESLPSRLTIEHIPLNETNRLGYLNAKNAPYVIHLLDKAFEGCQSDTYDAMVTAPLQKSIINDYGMVFTGHTEYLASKAGISEVVMMLCGEIDLPHVLPNSFMRVALATTHIALKDVAKIIKTEDILEKIQIIHQSCKQYFGLPHPRISVAGLNPHAGEGGYLGKEEIEIITPAIQQAKDLGIDVSGPFPGDTLFRYKNIEQVDVFLAMYHDQGLIPLKMATFGRGVNVTLGLPIIRTSVDHGTALDISAIGNADIGSMYQALQLAYQMVKNGSSGT